MVQLTPVEQRLSLLFEVLGVNVNTVTRDGVRIEPWGNGFALKWDGMAVLNPQQAAALVGPHTGDTDCPTCYSTERTATPGEPLPLIFCYSPEAEPTVTETSTVVDATIL